METSTYEAGSARPESRVRVSVRLLQLSPGLVTPHQFEKPKRVA
jgi:hypothetical protein